MVGRPTNSSPRAVACRRSRRQKAQCVVLLLARPYRGDRRGGSTCPLACFSGDGRWTSSQPVTAPPVPQSPCCAACTQPQAESAPMHGGLLVARPCAGDRRGVVALLFGCGSGDSRRVRRRHDGRRRKSHHTCCAKNGNDHRSSRPAHTHQVDCPLQHHRPTAAGPSCSALPPRRASHTAPGAGGVGGCRG